jgi:hypothetical protein
MKDPAEKPSGSTLHLMHGSDNLAVRPYCERSDANMVEWAFESMNRGTRQQRRMRSVNITGCPCCRARTQRSAASGAQDVPKSTIVL